jgi:hypothetical protein
VYRRGFRSSLITATLAVLCLTVLTSCNDKPTDIGSELVPGTDTIYASSTVTKDLLRQIGTKSERTPIYNSTYVLFGKTSDSEGRLFVEFIQWPKIGHPDSVVIVSSELEMTPQAYVFGDTNEKTLSVVAYELQQVWSANATWDSIWASDGSTPYYSTAQQAVAQFSSPIQTDTVVRVPIEVEATKRWFSIALDSTSSEELYGIVLLPTNTASIRQFRNLRSNQQIMRLRVVSRRNDTASLDTNLVEAAVACFVNTPPAPEGETVVQGARIHSVKYEIRIDSIPQFAVIAGSRFIVRVDNNRSSVGNLGSDEVLGLSYTGKNGSVLTMSTRRDENGVFEFHDIVPLLQRIRRDGGIGEVELVPVDTYYTWQMNRMHFHTMAEDSALRPYLSVVYILPNVFN